MDEPLSVTCSQCGEAFAPADIVTIRGVHVCAACKPFFLKRIQEGGEVVSKFIYAGFWKRFLADILDIFLLVIFNQAINKIFTFAFERRLNEFSLLFIISAVNILAGIAYYVFFNGNYGATPGKMAIGVKIVNTDGSPISYWKAFARYFGEMLSGAILGIGYYVAAFDDQKRTLHDRLCSTLVIKK